jgi:hypothetical protein
MELAGEVPQPLSRLVARIIASQVSCPFALPGSSGEIISIAGTDLRPAIQTDVCISFLMNSVRVFQHKKMHIP